MSEPRRLFALDVPSTQPWWADFTPYPSRVVAWVVLASCAIGVVVAARQAVQQPDYRVVSVDVSSSEGRPGDHVQVTEVTINSGLVSAPSATRTRLFLSRVPQSNQSMIPVGDVSVPPLGVKTSSTAVAEVSIPDNIASGRYFVVACADADRVLSERNERNNCRGSTASIVVQP